jgi:hypothetical protein
MHQRNRTPTASSRIPNSDRYQADGPQGTFQPGSNHRVLANKLGTVDPTEIAEVELVLLEKLYEALLSDALPDRLWDADKASYVSAIQNGLARNYDAMIGLVDRAIRR